MSFEITLSQFEGPLDLMLHLIKENKLDLLDLNMELLCEQYLIFLRAMDAMKLEIASEYLRELASLIEYKSKKLLPREKIEIKENYEEDQRDKLVARLLEYQRYKEACEVLEVNFMERSLQLEKPISEITTSWKTEEDAPLNVSAYDLMKAMSRVMRRFSSQMHYQTNLTVEELSIDERILQLKMRLVDFTGKLEFEELCEDMVTVHGVIVTFLALLDLIKNQFVTFMIDQEERIWVIK